MTNDPTVPAGSSIGESSAYMIAWDKGGYADVVLLTATRAVLRSTMPSPPGSRIDGRVLRGGSNGASVRFKIHGSKRQDDGTFLLESRPLDMLKDVRDALQTEASAGQHVTGQAAKAP